MGGSNCFFGFRKARFRGAFNVITALVLFLLYTHDGFIPNRFLGSSTSGLNLIQSSILCLSASLCNLLLQLGMCNSFDLVWDLVWVGERKTVTGEEER